MPKVPQYEPQAQVRPLQPNYESTRYGPEDFGGNIARGVGALGQGLDRVGDVAWRAAEAEKKKVSEARKSQASNVFAEFHRTYVVDEKTGLSQYKGLAAGGINDTLNEKFEGVVQSLRKQLKDPDQLADLDEVAERYRNQLHSDTARYEQRELDEAADTEHKGVIQNATQMARSRALSAEPGELQPQLDEVNEASAALSRLHGLGPVATSQFMLAQRSGFHLGVLDKLTDDDSPGAVGKAKRYLEDNREDIDPDALAKFEKHIESKLETHGAMAEAERIRKEVPDDPFGQRAKAKELLETRGEKFTSKVLAHIENEDRLEEAFRNRGDRAHLGALESQYIASKGIQDRDDKHYLALTEKGRGAADAMADRIRRQNAAKARGGSQTDPKQTAANRLALAYYGQMDPDEQEALDIKSTEIAELQGADDTTRLVIEGRRKRLVRDKQKGLLVDRGEFLTAARARASGMNKTDASLFVGKADAWRDRWLAGHGEKEPTREDVDKGLNDLLKEELIERRLLGVIPLPDKKVEAYKVKRTDKVTTPAAPSGPPAIRGNVDLDGPPRAARPGLSWFRKPDGGFIEVAPKNEEAAKKLGAKKVGAR